MDVNLGSKDPKREITLGKFGSIVFIVIFLAFWLTVAYGLYTVFLAPEDTGEVFIKCRDGSVEKIEEGTFTYCGEFVGVDTRAGIAEYLEKMNEGSVPSEPNFGIPLDEYQETFINIEE